MRLFDDFFFIQKAKEFEEELWKLNAILPSEFEIVEPADSKGTKLSHVLMFNNTVP